MSLLFNQKLCLGSLTSNQTQIFLLMGNKPKISVYFPSTEKKKKKNCGLSLLLKAMGTKRDDNRS